ncbi:MAG: carbohydrate-binding protein [Bacillota bacterium]|nr:carbohydrate-binding protein [Bacillota bacterium]
MYNMYYENGVIIAPNVLVKGDNASVIYKGILSNSGAGSVYMHVGYGDKWENTKDLKMRKSDEGFEADIEIASDQPIKFAFKDCANNWDNNSGRNYTFEVQSRL